MNRIAHHGQVRFIAGVQGPFMILKSFSTIHQTTDDRKKQQPIITLIDNKKNLTNSDARLVSKLGIEGNHVLLIKSIHRAAHNNAFLMVRD